jgi:hypothetical protein
MQITALMNSPLGKIFISILLGLGLAALLRTTCKEKNCIRFAGPILSEIDGKIYKHGDKCYKYESASAGKCDETKRVLDIEVRAANAESSNGGSFL